MSWRRFLHRNWWDGERAREIDSYLEIETAHNVERGMTPAEAAAAARRKLGNPGLVREEIYQMNSVPRLETLWQDLCYGARLLRLSPGFALVAILSLSLGIGANTAIFQLLDAVRLRSLPVEKPQELAEIRIIGGNLGLGVGNGPYGGLTRPIWQEIQKQEQAFTGVFAWAADDFRLGQGADQRRANGIRISGDFFRVLGVQPWRGRLILPEDEAPCPSTRAVVSYAYWQSQMGGRELESSSKIVVDGALHQVIGVTPRAFFGLAVGESFDIALPFCQPKEMRRDVWDVTVMGRLRPDWTLPRASAHLDAISAGIFETTALTGYSAKTIDTYKHFRLAAYPASAGVSWLRKNYDSSLWLLLAITGLVLLIACANLANLMLARASTRERELAVRVALGASRGRLLRQLLMESALLAAAGAMLGIGLAQVVSRVLVWSLSTESDSINLSIETDWRVLLFAIAVTALTCAVFGVLPAVRATRTDPIAAIKAGGRSLTSARERLSVQRLMVVVQIAVSLVLLVSALWFTRSFRNLMTFDPGMRENGITIAFIDYEQSHLAADQYDAFNRQLVDDIRNLPGILNAATTTNTPLLGGSWTHTIHLEAVEGPTKFTWVSPSYFDTMGIPLLAGRAINANDTEASQRVAVVNQTFVRRFLGGANPIGKTLRTIAEPNYPATAYQIVGVIADTKYAGLREETPPMTFAPAPQCPAKGPGLAVMVYSNLPPATAIATVKAKFARSHPEMNLEFVDFQRRIRDGLLRERLMAVLSGFFGLLAAVLAVVGLYGVISYTVARRRNEIGVRVALGAGRTDVISMVMREAGKLVAIGMIAGTGLSLLAGRAARALLFELKPSDPLTLVTAIGLLAAVAALASFLPARRASKMDPMAALRCD